MKNRITNTDLRGALKPHIKTKWVEALRSGDYKKAKGALARDGGFCCLGVLCDLQVVPGEWYGEHFVPKSTDVATQRADLDHSFVGAVVTDALYIEEVNDFFNGLAGRNDGDRRFKSPPTAPQSHRKLADLIERNL